jgi:hypothetical protein
MHTKAVRVNMCNGWVYLLCKCGYTCIPFREEDITGNWGSELKEKAMKFLIDCHLQYNGFDLWH